MKNLLDFLPQVKNLLIVDLNSLEFNFYFQKDATELVDLDFSKLKKIKGVKTKILQDNLLASKDSLDTYLSEELKMIKNSGYLDFKLIFLFSHDTSELEREALKSIAIRLSFFHYQLVERQFFYHQFLMQQKNFSKEKLMLFICGDKLELFLFKDRKLVFSRIIADFQLFQDDLQQLNFLTKSINDFLFDFSLRKTKTKLEYLYIFGGEVLKKELVNELSRNLKLESIITKSLC